MIIEIDDQLPADAMAPVESLPPRKRMSPDSDSGRCIEEPPTKRVRMEPELPRTPPPEEDIFDGSSKARFADDDPHQLLLRSIALALQHVGFDSASPEALEAFCSQVDTCQDIHFCLFVPCTYSY